jgi:hypothetical protein
LVGLQSSLVSYYYFNGVTHVASFQSLEIYAGPVGYMSVHRTTVFISIPDRKARFSFEFEFTSLTKPYFFVIKLPFSIIKDNTLYLPVVTLPQSGFEWSDNNMDTRAFGEIRKADSQLALSRATFVAEL